MIRITTWSGRGMEVCAIEKVENPVRIAIENDLKVCRSTFFFIMLKIVMIDADNIALK